MITKKIQEEEGLSDAEVAHLEKLLDEIERSSGSMTVEIWKPKAVIYLDSSVGGQHLDSNLFGEKNLETLRRLGERLVLESHDKKDKRLKIRKDIFAIVKDYVEYRKPEQLWELSVTEGGWMGHLTMPGYMDQTEPTHYDTLSSAIEDLHNQFADIDVLAEDEGEVED